jgi:hypothetical protein
VGAFLSYASGQGQVLIDRELYLPEGGQGPRLARTSWSIRADRNANQAENSPTECSGGLWMQASNQRGWWPTLSAVTAGAQDVPRRVGANQKPPHRGISERGLLLSPWRAPAACSGERLNKIVTEPHGVEYTLDRTHTSALRVRLLMSLTTCGSQNSYRRDGLK